MPHIKSTAISISPGTATVYAGNSVTLKASLTSAVAGEKSNDDITWTTSNARIAKVSAGGGVTGVGYGTATITAKSESGDSAKATISVKTIKASHSSEKLIGGVVYYAKFKTYGTGSTPLKYSSSDKAIATVNESSGRVQVNRGEKASDSIKTGTVTITAKTPAGDSASMKIKVADEPVIADLSKWQGNIDWSVAKRTIDLAILRVSYGARTMAEVEHYEFKYPSYSTSCVKEDIPYAVYDYVLYKTKSQAEKEATIFYKASTAGNRRPLFFVVDAEESFLTWANTKAFIAKLRSLAKKDYGGRVRVGLYIGQYVYKDWKLKAPLQNLNDSKTPDFVWIPRYGVGNTGTINSSTLPNQPCDMWQFTSSAYVPGISGKVDLSTLYDQSGGKLSNYSGFGFDWLIEGGPATSIK
jgi:GH25 family lysozyme M1 (1,4-beta-N-acetylmuramidase)